MWEGEGCCWAWGVFMVFSPFKFLEIWDLDLRDFADAK
jgi:hypothetical protein